MDDNSPIYTEFREVDLRLPIVGNRIVVGRSPRAISEMSRLAITKIGFERTPMAGDVNQVDIAIHFAEPVVDSFMCTEDDILETGRPIDGLVASNGPNGPSTVVHHQATDTEPAGWTELDDNERLFRSHDGDHLISTWPELIYEGAALILRQARNNSRLAQS